MDTVPVPELISVPPRIHTACTFAPGLPESPSPRMTILPPPDSSLVPASKIPAPVVFGVDCLAYPVRILLPPPSVMSPPLDKILGPVDVAEAAVPIKMPPPLAASLSAHNTALSLPNVELIETPADTWMSPWAFRVNVALPPAVLAMLAFTKIFPFSDPPAPVAKVTLVPAFSWV